MNVRSLLKRYVEDGRRLFSSEHDYVMVVALPTTEEIRSYDSVVKIKKLEV